MIYRCVSDGSRCGFWYHGRTTFLLYSGPPLTHWARLMDICVSKLAIIGSDNGLSPGRWQAIIWTNTGILSTGPLGTNFNEMLYIYQNSYIFNEENAFENIVCGMAAILSRPQWVNRLTVGLWYRGDNVSLNFVAYICMCVCLLCLCIYVCVSVYLNFPI